jgi:hypothetical protein
VFQNGLILPKNLAISSALANHFLRNSSTIAEFFAFLFLKRIFLTMFIGQAGRTFSYN